MAVQVRLGDHPGEQAMDGQAGHPVGAWSCLPAAALSYCNP